MSVFRDRMGNELTVRQAGEKVVGRVSNIFLDFELMLLRWVGYIPFHSIRKFFYTLSGMRMGKDSTIHMWANFFYPPNVKIGEGTTIGDHAFLDGRDKLVIGDHVDIASSVMIFNSEHDINSEDFHAMIGFVEIGDYVFIGPRVIILPGVRIGRGAVIAAGAVVTKNVEDGAVVGGVPAEKIGERKVDNLHYKLGRARLFQ